MPISPVIMNVMPIPRRGAGILSLFRRSLIAAIQIMATNQPIPEPAPKTVAVHAFGKSRCCINNTVPNIAQLTAMRGRNIPKEL